MADVNVQGAINRVVSTVDKVFDKEVADFAQVYKKTEVYTKDEVDAKVASVYKFKGNVADFAALPSTGQVAGDVYNCTDTGDNYAWTGTDWDKLAGTVDLTAYAKTTEVTQAVATETDARTAADDALRTLIMGNTTIDDTALAALEAKLA